MCFVEGNISIPELVADARRALEANAQFSALSVTLGIVDECATVEWEKRTGKKPQLKENQKSFAQWVDMWESAENCDENIKNNMVSYEKQCKNSRKTDNGMLPKLNGELLYKIRCSILHAMSSNIDFKNIGLSDDANRHIEEFLFITSKPIKGMMGDALTSCDKNKHNTLCIDVQQLTEKLLYLIEVYYKKADSKRFNTISLYDFTNEYIMQ